MSKSIGIRDKVKKIFPSEIMLTFYFSVIHTYIMYLLEFWYSAPAHISSRINILQKKSIRIVYNLPYNAHSTNYFTVSKLLTSPYLSKRSILLYIFKAVNLGYDDFFLSLLVRNAERALLEHAQ